MSSRNIPNGKKLAQYITNIPGNASDMIKPEILREIEQLVPIRAAAVGHNKAA